MQPLCVTKSDLDGQDLVLHYNDGHTATFVRPPMRVERRVQSRFYVILARNDRPVMSFRSGRTPDSSELEMAKEGYSLEHLLAYMEAADMYFTGETHGVQIVRQLRRALAAMWQSDRRAMKSVRRRMYEGR